MYVYIHVYIYIRQGRKSTSTSPDPNRPHLSPCRIRDMERESERENFRGKSADRLASFSPDVHPQPLDVMSCNPAPTPFSPTFSTTPFSPTSFFPAPLSPTPLSSTPLSPHNFPSRGNAPRTSASSPTALPGTSSRDTSPLFQAPPNNIASHTLSQVANSPYPLYMPTSQFRVSFPAEQGGGDGGGSARVRELAPHATSRLMSQSPPAMTPPPPQPPHTNAMHLSMFRDQHPSAPSLPPAVGAMHPGGQGFTNSVAAPPPCKFSIVSVPRQYPSVQLLES